MLFIIIISCKDVGVEIKEIGVVCYIVNFVVWFVVCCGNVIGLRLHMVLRFVSAVATSVTRLTCL